MSDLHDFAMIFKYSNKSLKYFSILRPMKNDATFEMSHEEMSTFVSFPLFVFNLVIELRNFDFQSHWNTLIFFDQKNDLRFQYVMQNKVWFKLRCLCRILTRWEIRILNYIEVKYLSIKCYLRYKMIPSQNVSCEAQIKNFSIS